MKKIISLGAGIQSSAMILMAENGFIEKPDLAIFSDTQDELPETYEWIENLKNKTSIKIVTVTAGQLSESILNGAYYIEIPFRGSEGGLGMRQCTDRFKIRPLRNYLRTHFKKESFEIWLGITTDEAHRMKDSPVKYCTNRYPLIENGFSRSNCESWLRKNGHPVPPKSACFFCPFHRNSHWKQMKNRPEWETIEKIDKKLNLEGKFLHVSKKPINDIDLESQQELFGFGNECEGFCGT
jgi:hypothetical protein